MFEILAYHLSLIIFSDRSRLAVSTNNISQSRASNLVWGSRTLAGYTEMSVFAKGMLDFPEVGSAH